MDREYVKEIIANIQAESRKNNIEPDYALMSAIKYVVTEDLTNTLREMYKDREVECHKTLNSVGFSVKGGGNEQGLDG